MLAVDCLSALLVPETATDGSQLQAQRMTGLLLIVRALRAQVALGQAYTK